MQRYRANSLDGPIGRRDITGGHGASKADQVQGFSRLDAESDAVPVYEWTDDGVTVTPARGLLRRGLGNATEDGRQRGNDNPER